MNKGILTNAEYKALRTYLGLSQEEATRLHGLKNVKTVQRWENGHSFISDIACNKLLEIFGKVQTVIEGTLAQFSQDGGNANDRVVLIIYPDDCYREYVTDIGDLPNSVHQSMMNKLYIELRHLGVDAHIVMFDKTSYQEWLANSRQQDGHEARSLWAIQYYSFITSNSVNDDNPEA